MQVEKNATHSRPSASVHFSHQSGARYALVIVTRRMGGSGGATH